MPSAGTAAGLDSRLRGNDGAERVDSGLRPARLIATQNRMMIRLMRSRKPHVPAEAGPKRSTPRQCSDPTPSRPWTQQPDAQQEELWFGWP